MAADWTAYWTVRPRHGVLRTEPARDPGVGEVLVRTLFSGVSRGTEMLVHRGTFRRPSPVRCAHRSRPASGPVP